MGIIGPDGREQLKTFARVGATGLETALAVVVGAYGGRWLDSSFGTSPYLMTAGVAVGALAGFRGLYHLSRKYRSQEDRDRDLT